MRLNFCCDIQMVGCRFVVNNMKARMHPVTAGVMVRGYFLDLLVQIERH